MSQLSSIKRFIAKRFPYLYDMAQILRTFSKASSRATMQADKDAICLLNEQLGDQYLGITDEKFDKTVLFFSISSIDAILLEVPVIAAFQKAGYNPIILASRNIQLRKAYALLGLHNISFIDIYQEPIDIFIFKCVNKPYKLELFK